jgi:hypothetical protein
MAGFGRKYDAYAHLSGKAARDKDVAILNVAHASDTRFKTGDKINVTNIGSGQSETTVVEITSAYIDIDHSDVLIQLGEQPVNNEGKIHVKIYIVTGTD